MSTELIDMIVGIGGAVAGFLRRRGRRPKHEELVLGDFPKDLSGRPIKNSTP